jgi:aldehyde dehydrogenase (NAD+)
MPPTLLTDPPADSRAYSLKTFRREAEAVALANDFSYELPAVIFTASMPRALRVTRALHVGIVGVNCPVMPLTQLPGVAARGVALAAKGDCLAWMSICSPRRS